MRKKRKHVFLFFILLILGIGTIGTFVAIGLYNSASNPEVFVRERRSTARRMYADTVGRDISENYPNNPTQLMELYLTSYTLLHGDFIVDPDTFMNVINFQRELFSDELRATTTAREQYDNLMRNLSIFRAEDPTLLQSLIENVQYDFREQRSALVNVEHRFMFQDSLFRVYHLIMDDVDRWRINSWAEADENFEILEMPE